MPVSAPASGVLACSVVYSRIRSSTICVRGPVLLRRTAESTRGVSGLRVSERRVGRVQVPLVHALTSRRRRPHRARPRSGGALAVPAARRLPRPDRAGVVRLHSGPDLVGQVAGRVAGSDARARQVLPWWSSCAQVGSGPGWSEAVRGHGGAGARGPAGLPDRRRPAAVEPTSRARGWPGADQAFHCRGGMRNPSGAFFGDLGLGRLGRDAWVW